MTTGSINLTVFESDVLRRLKKVPRGKVTTYGELARAVKRPGAARAVGNALHKNPRAPGVPCHRVVKSDGQSGGYARGPGTKVSLLKREGVIVKKSRIEGFKRVLHRFK